MLILVNLRRDARVQKLKTWPRKATLGTNHARYIASIESLSTQRQMFLVLAEMKSFIFVQISHVICSCYLPESILSSHGTNIRILKQNIAQRLRIGPVKKYASFRAATHADKDTLMLIGRVLRQVIAQLSRRHGRTSQRLLTRTNQRSKLK